MNAAARRLVIASALLLAVMLVGAVVAVAAGWPAQFGGAGDPNDVAGEALTRGTALSPPVAPVAAFVVALVLSMRPGLVGVVATVVLMLLAIVFVIGGMGEALAEPTADVPRAALVLSGVLATVAGLAVVATAVQRLRVRP